MQLTIANRARLPEWASARALPGGVSGSAWCSSCCSAASRSSSRVIAAFHGSLRHPVAAGMSAKAGIARSRPGTTPGDAVSDKGTILVVDDDRLVLARWRMARRRPATDADNGDDAILLAREHKPDPALLTSAWRGKSGFDVAPTRAKVLPDPVHVPVRLRRRDRPGQGAFGAAATWSNRWTSARSCRPSRSPWRAPAAARRFPAQCAAEAGLHPTVAMAVGVLMHRYCSCAGAGAAGASRAQRQPATGWSSRPSACCRRWNCCPAAATDRAPVAAPAVSPAAA